MTVTRKWASATERPVCALSDGHGRTVDACTRRREAGRAESGYADGVIEFYRDSWKAFNGIYRKGASNSSGGRGRWRVAHPACLAGPKLGGQTPRTRCVSPRRNRRIVSETGVWSGVNAHVGFYAKESVTRIGVSSPSRHPSVEHVSREGDLPVDGGGVAAVGALGGGWRRSGNRVPATVSAADPTTAGAAATSGLLRPAAAELRDVHAERAVQQRRVRHAPEPAAVLRVRLLLGRSFVPFADAGAQLRCGGAGSQRVRLARHHPAGVHFVRVLLAAAPGWRVRRVLLLQAWRGAGLQAGLSADGLQRDGAPAVRRGEQSAAGERVAVRRPRVLLRPDLLLHFQRPAATAAERFLLRAAGHVLAQPHPVVLLQTAAVRVLQLVGYGVRTRVLRLVADVRVAGAGSAAAGRAGQAAKPAVLAVGAADHPAVQHQLRVQGGLHQLRQVVDASVVRL
eukprot:ctg_1092.g244